MKTFQVAMTAFLTVVFTTSIGVAQATECDERSGEGCYSYEYEISEIDQAEFAVDRTLMTNAVLQKLTVWTRPADDSQIYARHCRQLTYGCEKEISVLVDYIFDVSIQAGFDPWLLAAIAWHESRFNPFAESSEGAVGLVQILRRSRWSQGLQFVRQRWYRQQCRREFGSCQRPIVERAVYWLKRSIEHCGSVHDGLRMYNSGRCNGPRRYPRAVFAAMADITNRAKAIVENNFFVFTQPNNERIFVKE